MIPLIATAPLESLKRPVSLSMRPVGDKRLENQHDQQSPRDRSPDLVRPLWTGCDARPRLCWLILLCLGQPVDVAKGCDRCPFDLGFRGLNVPDHGPPVFDGDSWGFPRALAGDGQT